MQMSFPHQITTKMYAEYTTSSEAKKPRKYEGNFEQNIEQSVHAVSQTQSPEQEKRIYTSATFKLILFVYTNQ